MKKKRLIVVTAILTALMFCVETTAVSAASLSEIRQQIKEKQAELEEGQEEESSLASEVAELEEQIADIESSINELESAISDGEDELAVLEVELEEAEEKVETQNENLGSRLRTMYKSGTVGFLDVLLNSSSFSEFLTNLDLVETIYASDQDVLEELQDAYDEIEAKKLEIEELQAELEESKSVAEAEQSSLEAEKTSVEAKKAEIAESNEETEQMIDDLNATADKMTSTIKSNSSVSTSSTSTYSGGTLSWPCSGTISSEFGYRLHPIYGYYKLHTGLDIAVSTGTPIKAAASGTVILSQYYGSYGYCVMIDHGGGMVTLYAHNSSLAVSKGQSVSRGQTIAYAGSTGASTGSHCHFEVRIDGAYKNPRNYLQ